MKLGEAETSTDFDRTRAEEPRSYSDQTCTVAADIAVEVAPIAVALGSLLRMTIVGQSNYTVTHNHRNLDSCCSNFGSTCGPRPAWNSLMPY